jgi:hypothetical protein
MTRVTFNLTEVPFRFILGRLMPLALTNSADVVGAVSLCFFKTRISIIVERSSRYSTLRCSRDTDSHVVRNSKYSSGNVLRILISNSVCGRRQSSMRKDSSFNSSQSFCSFEMWAATESAGSFFILTVANTDALTFVLISVGMKFAVYPTFLWLFMVPLPQLC